VEVRLKEVLLEVYRTEFGRDYCFPEVEIDDSPIWWFNRGLAFHNIGRDAGAEVPFKEALRMFKVEPGTEIEQATCLMNLGSVYESTSKFYEAETNYKEALKMYKAILGTEIEQARCLMNLGTLYSTIQEYSKARSMLESALDICRQYPIGTEQIKNVCLKYLSQIS